MKIIAKNPLHDDKREEAELVEYQGKRGVRFKDLPHVFNIKQFGIKIKTK